MHATVTTTHGTRTQQRTRITPASAGLPDPRPVTDLSVAYSEIDGRSRLTVTLSSPCVIREPRWAAIDVRDGSTTPPVLGKPQGNAGIIFDFDELLVGTICFLEVPLQDMQVQNFQGGFVRPGAKWFRAPE